MTTEVTVSTRHHEGIDNGNSCLMHYSTIQSSWTNLTYPRVTLTSARETQEQYGISDTVIFKQVVIARKLAKACILVVVLTHHHLGDSLVGQDHESAEPLGGVAGLRETITLLLLNSSRSTISGP